MTSIFKKLSTKFVRAAHDEQVRDHGGLLGVRDEGLLESALARAENLAAYGQPDLFDLATAYAFGIISNHPFADGNKRTALICTVVFLDLNGWEMDAPEAELCMAMVALAQKDMNEADFAAWLKAQVKEIEKK